MKELIFLATIFISFTAVRTENFCTGERAGGLLALTQCKNPVTGEPIGKNGECEDRTAKLTSCCVDPSKLDDCPVSKGNYDYNGDDEYTYEGGDYGGRVQSIQQIQEQRLCPIVNGKQWITCHYNQDEFTPDIEDQCTTLEELNEFAECQQGCQEIYPAMHSGKKPVDNGIDYVPDNGGDDYVPDNGGDDDYPEDYGEYDIALLGGRTDSIGGAAKEKKCGTREFTEQVLPENEAIMGEFPWACSLFTQGIGGNEEKYLGGCTIIPNGRDNDIQKPTYRVITAASKVKLAKNDPLKVRVRFTNRNDGSLEEDHTVASVVSHPDFKAGRLLNNIATMVLDEPIDLVKEEGVNAACMPACSEMFVHTFKNHTGVRCWSAGFGAQERNGPLEFKLRKVDIPIYPDKAKCEKIINEALTEARGGKKGRRTKLNAGEICAGGEKGKDTCSGDGGSPLVCQAVSGRWHVVGLVSWGIGCGVEGRPAIYTNVFEYVDFIYSLMGPCSDGNFYVRGAGRNPAITCPDEF